VQKTLAVGAALTGIVRCSHTTSRPNVYICAMDDNNNTQHMNTVINFEVKIH